MFFVIPQGEGGCLQGWEGGDQRGTEIKRKSGKGGKLYDIGKGQEQMRKKGNGKETIRKLTKLGCEAW